MPAAPECGNCTLQGDKNIAPIQISHLVSIVRKCNVATKARTLELPIAYTSVAAYTGSAVFTAKNVL
jgi:hypothetical protein